MVDVPAFQRGFNEFSGGLFGPEFDWTNIVAAGGAVQRVLSMGAVEGEDARSGTSDIDLFWFVAVVRGGDGAGGVAFASRFAP